ncbi:UNVERIFIED_CONTAM: hypothetical protein Sradi_2336200 [Sesamum radiatum]|uniref:Uncharacterized protein n=1 Tax=Sesamum radiatum TaxID=300843 RepID=A0AAW2T5C8_SESRA
MANKYFRECLRDCDMTDIGYKGDIFTWSNHRETPHTVRARLDRACCSPKWTCLFPFDKVMHEAVACSDHALLCINLSQNSIKQPNRKRRQFRFEVAWTSSLECADVDHHTWNSPKASIEIIYYGS